MNPTTVRYVPFRCDKVPDGGTQKAGISASGSLCAKPGMATLVLIHSMIGLKWGKFLALAHFKTRKRVLK
jgi:hypothetical protein